MQHGRGEFFLCTENILWGKLFGEFSERLCDVIDLIINKSEDH